MAVLAHCAVCCVTRSRRKGFSFKGSSFYVCMVGALGFSNSEHSGFEDFFLKQRRAWD